MGSNNSKQYTRGATIFGGITLIYLIIFLSIPSETRTSLSTHLMSYTSTYSSSIASHLSSTSYQSNSDLPSHSHKVVDADQLPSLGSKWLRSMRGGIALHNMPQEEKLQKALKKGWKCGETRETQMVLVGTHWIEDQFDGQSAHGGEIYWFNSFVRAAERLGHPVLLVPPSFDGEMHLAREYHEKYPGCLKVVVADDGLARKEYSDPRKPDPKKLPASRVLSYDYFGDPWFLDSIFGLGAGTVSPPLGRKTVLTANPFPPFPEYNSVSYAIDRQSIPHKPIPRSLRPGGSHYPIPGSKRQVYVYGKHTSYLLRSVVIDHLKAVADNLNVELVLAMDDDIGVDGILKENGIINHGVLTPDEFYKALSNCVAIVGLGDPMVSPTAYEALYLGVSFLNPIKEWDQENPSDDSKWVMQHAWLHHSNADHVYNVFAHDIQSLQASLQKALTDEFESYTLPTMSQSAVDARVAEVLDQDWDKIALEFLEEQEDAQRKIKEQQKVRGESVE